ncbi:MAG: hypothetical protein CMD58_02630 [Gammaproteobacteria bacterium]|nr:hypothetical protein [Gammaproteobacteria bacterium]|tara:strand:- start:1449 stop:1913 length:465 start_codon:yes stop_codon:yes gene_type:complete
MDSNLKNLVNYKEISNLYIDLSQTILKKINFDSSSSDRQNQILYINCFENSLFYLADHIYCVFSKNADEIKNLNFKYKWIELSNFKSIKNIINKEIQSDGLIYDLEALKNQAIQREEIDQLITSSQLNNLKKFKMILDKYKSFEELLRKTLDEC